jgi:hypothetical protein
MSQEFNGKRILKGFGAVLLVLVALYLAWVVVGIALVQITP